MQRKLQEAERLWINAERGLSPGFQRKHTAAFIDNALKASEGIAGVGPKTIILLRARIGCGRQQVLKKLQARGPAW